MQQRLSRLVAGGGDDRDRAAGIIFSSWPARNGERLSFDRGVQLATGLSDLQYHARGAGGSAIASPLVRPAHVRSVLGKGGGGPRCGRPRPSRQPRSQVRADAPSSSCARPDRPYSGSTASSRSERSENGSLHHTIAARQNLHARAASHGATRPPRALSDRPRPTAISRPAY